VRSDQIDISLDSPIAPTSADTATNGSLEFRDADVGSTRTALLLFASPGVAISEYGPGDGSAGPSSLEQPAAATPAGASASLAGKGGAFPQHKPDYEKFSSGMNAAETPVLDADGASLFFAPNAVQTVASSDLNQFSDSRSAAADRAIPSSNSTMVDAGAEAQVPADVASTGPLFSLPGNTTSTGSSDPAQAPSGTIMATSYQQAGLIINVTWNSDVSNAPAAFKTDVMDAVRYFESIFTNPITVGLTVDYSNLAGAIGESQESQISGHTYAQVKAALAATAATPDAIAAAKSLPTADPTNGSTIFIPGYQAEALGLAPTNSYAGEVLFSTGYAFDYTNNGTVPAGQFDFMGIVYHELTEVMGRQLDLCPSFFFPMDFFHYTAPGALVNNGTVGGYFSINAGATNLNSFNPSLYGDPGDLGMAANVFNAAASAGVINPVTANDITMLNAIGWNLAPATVSSVVASGTGITSGVGDLNAGHVVTLTITVSEPVNVTGTPTLSLNDGGTATYAGNTFTYNSNGAPVSVLTFHYTVGAGQNAASLAITGVNLPGGATIKDGGGSAVGMTGALTTLNGLQIDTTTPAISSIVESPSSGDLNVGKTVTLRLGFSETVTVAGGTPTLTLNDGGIAIYTRGSGTSALTFSYTVAAGQNTSALKATAVNRNGATIQNGAGTAARLSLTGLTQTGPQIDTTTPAIASVGNVVPSSDGHGGTQVVDPPLSASAAAGFADPILLSQYLAAFAGPGRGGGACLSDNSPAGQTDQGNLAAALQHQ
jgi:hypothetical protein